MKNIKTATAVLAALAPNVLFAQDSASPSPLSDIERYVVVANRTEVPIRELTTSVSVITDEALITRGYVNLADVLRFAPGISVARSGGVGAQTTLRIRGEEGFRTQVRIDGVNISDPTGVQIGPQLDHLQSANIGRVEILRGAQGLAYGADAGGVVNIETRQYEDAISGRLFAETGRFNTQNIAGDIGGSSDVFNYYFSAQDFSSDGINARIDDTSQDDDGYDNQTYHTRLGVAVNDNFSLTLIGRHTKGEGEYDNCFDNAFSRSDSCASVFNQANLRAQGDYLTENSSHQLAFAKTLIDREFFTLGESTFFTKGHTERVEYISHWALSTHNKINMGADWQQDAITEGDISRRLNRGLFAEYQGQINQDIFVTLGTRFDDNDDFGDHLSYRVSAAKIWSLDDYEFKIRSAYGTGFRAPSLFEIAYNQGPFAFPPASSIDLKEEQSEGGELGVSLFDSNTFSYEIVYFNQRVDNAIIFDVSGFSGYLQDDDQSRSKGVELIGQHQVSEHFSVSGNYTYNDTDDFEGQRRIGRPRHSANLGFVYNQNKLQFAANARIIKDVVDIIGALEDYELLDITAQYFFNDALTLHGRLENALDEDYTEVGGFNTQGASFNVGLSYIF